MSVNQCAVDSATKNQIKSDANKNDSDSQLLAHKSSAERKVSANRGILQALLAPLYQQAVAVNKVKETQ